MTVSIALSIGLAGLLGVGSASGVPRAASLALPDLQVLVPTGAISIGANSSTGDRQLQFTHVTWDAGAGPFAIQPAFDPATGRSRFSQVLYTMPTPGRWSVASHPSLGVQGIFEAPSDYRYPLTRFTLNHVGAGGTIGAVVRVSPKVDYCITGDAYVGGVPNTPSQTSPPQSDCTNRNALLGFSVGWGDQYDQTDNGQPIDLTGVPDGAYLLRAVVDPEHLFTQSNRANDVVDTKLQISGSNVTVLSQNKPHIAPPSVHVSSPAPGATVKGTAFLQASASASSPSRVAWVQYLLDGVPLGPRIAAAPYRYVWPTGPLPAKRQLSAQVMDTAGMESTASVITVYVARSRTRGLSVDTELAATGRGVVRTAPLSTTVAGDTLVAFSGLDGPQAGAQSTRVTGLGLTWHLVRRSNQQAGDAEVWTARATKVIHRLRVTSTPKAGGFAQDLVVVAYSGAKGIGASAVGAASNGAPTVALTTKGAGSIVLAIGSDWDQAIPRSPSVGDSILQQWVDGGDGETFWVQGPQSAVAKAATKVVVSDTAPTADRWDLAAVEVEAAPLPAANADVIVPARGEVVAGTTAVTVALHDGVSVRAVRILLDGRPLGFARVVDGGEFAALRWRTTGVAKGSHALEVVVGDAASRRLIASSEVFVSNPLPPMTCFVLQADVSATGGAVVTSPLVHIVGAGERLFALVRATRSATDLAMATDRLAWRRIGLQQGPGGLVAVFTTLVPRGVTNLRATSLVRGGSQSLTLLAIEGSDGLGAIASKSAPGPRRVTLTVRHSTSLVLVVGTGEASVAHGWVPLASGRIGGRATWVFSTNQPVARAGTTLALPQSRSRGRWMLVAIELPGEDG